MTSPLRIHGIVPPVPTPLTADGRVDAPAFRRIFDHLVTGGVHAAFILGSTGELASLTPALRKTAIQAAVRAADGRIPVLVGIADPCLETSVELAALAAELGADAVVAAAPFYYELTSGELLRHFDKLVPRLALPALIYNMPWLTGHVLAADCLRGLLQHPNVIGFKDSSADPNYLRRLVEIASVRPDVTVLVGNDYLFLEGLEMGAHGAVAGGSDLYPAFFRQLYDAFQRGDLQEAKEIQARIARLGQEIFDITGRPTSVFAAIKGAMACLGLCEPHVAPPLTECTARQMDRLREILSGLQLPAAPSIA